MPRHVREEDARGFALALGKMVLTNGVGEVVNMARLNVRTIAVCPGWRRPDEECSMPRPKAAIAIPHGALQPQSGWRLPQPEQVAERIKHLAQPLTSHDRLRAPVRARAVLAPLSHRGVDVGDCPIRDRPGRPRLIELICLMQRQPSAGKVEHHQLRSSGNRCGTKPRRIPRRRSGKISDEVEDISWRTQSCGHAICLVHEAKRRTPAGDRHRRPAAAQIRKPSAGNHQPP